MNEITDQQLLREFGAHHSEAAFAELVRRYVDLVYSAAVRLAVDLHLAEDVTQMVFVALAQQAGQVERKVADGAPLSGWLHVTARNLAAKTVRTEVRRRNREEEAAAMHELSAAETAAAWDQMSPHLDHALGELTESDRDALLLRFFERKTAREIGRRLGLSEEAAQKRITRALERLRERIAARGVAVSAAAFAGILAAHTVQAAPLALAGGILQSAMAASAAVAAPAGVSVWFAKLAPSLVMSKTQTALVLAIAAAIAIPLTVQQSALNKVRAGLAAPSAPAAIAAVPAPVASARQLRESEDDEIARLRREAADLRDKLAAKRTQLAATSGPPKTALGPTLLAVGQRVGMRKLVFAGHATPEAALQSLMTFRRDGDVYGMASLALFSPERVERWNEILASPEEREALSRQLIQSAQGAVMESSAQVHEDGTVSEPRVATKLPESPLESATVEILDKVKMDERRVQFTVRIVRGNKADVETLQFGLTGSGWKGID